MQNNSKVMKQLLEEVPISRCAEILVILLEKTCEGVHFLLKLHFVGLKLYQKRTPSLIFSKI